MAAITEFRAQVEAVLVDIAGWVVQEEREVKTLVPLGLAAEVVAEVAVGTTVSITSEPVGVVAAALAFLALAHPVLEGQAVLSQQIPLLVEVAVLLGQLALEQVAVVMVILLKMGKAAVAVEAAVVHLVEEEAVAERTNLAMPLAAMELSVPSASSGELVAPIRQTPQTSN